MSFSKTLFCIKNTILLYFHILSSEKEKPSSYYWWKIINRTWEITTVILIHTSICQFMNHSWLSKSTTGSAVSRWAIHGHVILLKTNKTYLVLALWPALLLSVFLSFRKTHLSRCVEVTWWQHLWTTEWKSHRPAHIRRGIHFPFPPCCLFALHVFQCWGFVLDCL